MVRNPYPGFGLLIFVAATLIVVAGAGPSARGQANNGLSTPGPNSPPPVPAPPTIVTPAAAAPTTANSKLPDVRYPVTGIDLDYSVVPDTKGVRAQLPSLQSLLDLKVTLAKLPGGGLTAPTEGQPVVMMSIRNIGSQAGEVIDKTGLTSVENQIIKFINDRGIIGVYVSPNEEDIGGESSTDNRQGKRTRIRLTIFVATVESVRTLASGDRVNFDDRLNNKLHKPIIDHSPIKGSQGGKSAQLLNKDQLDDYILLLNREPGRHVDVAVSEGTQPGQVVLDYLIAENRTFPPTVYIQGSNTGTKETQLWRERVGIDWDQLTNHDDNLTIDYVTSSFKDTNAVQAQYDFPVSYDRKLRSRVFFDYSAFDANDLGISAKGDFSGNDLDLGAELAYTFEFRHGLFFDLFAGATGADYHGSQANVNPATGQREAPKSGTALFYRPYVGVRGEKGSDFSSISGEVRMTLVASNANITEVDQLGLPNAVRSYPLFQGSLTESFYIEPLLLSANSATGTLAHELYFNIRGQSTFDHPSLAQDQQTVGGLYTVRGYPESFVAGDDAFIGTAEYRFHIPRALTIATPSDTPPDFLGAPFHFRPTRKFGKPDWDLIARVFADYGRTYEAQASGNYTDHYLLGVGTGLELQFRQNLTIRAEWGVPLVGATDVNNEHVSAGRSSRLHFVATFVY